ncbi:uncharacterized protein PV07_09331 [Cladophialophora immunda]|uniref:Aldehyde dehydrogenase domain-containing protein n=1 Tax=Cladophialophora immunda TaxID=569365 RepID=A0A0D2C4V6_9EURO|nr:uncharacterized protein PV07_09331 [Cladophialophora immunda]KIW26218.1 hypothetical protein PV07_09331 [Cladophialophora immunda]OQU96060.1 hypothetical protein CLAIMM_02196 [Cladophialophora immunda]
MDTAFATALTDRELFAQKAYVNGQWVSSSSQAKFEVRDKTTDAVMGTCPDMNTDDLDDAIQAATTALPEWSALGSSSRVRFLQKISLSMLSNRADIGQIVATETGKPVAEAEAEVAFAASFFDSLAEKITREDVIGQSDNLEKAEDTVIVCAVVVPRELSLAIGARKVAIALAAGSTAVVLPDARAPFSSNVVAVLSERAGLPKGVLNVVSTLGNTEQLSLALYGSATLGQILLL